MSRGPAGVRAAVLAAALALGAGTAPAVEAERPQLRMEEIEVHGAREKPAALFQPAPPRVSTPSTVRYDLFLEDATRPLPPWRIANDNIVTGGTSDHEDLAD